MCNVIYVNQKYTWNIKTQEKSYSYDQYVLLYTLRTKKSLTFKSTVLGIKALIVVTAFSEIMLYFRPIWQATLQDVVVAMSYFIEQSVLDVFGNCRYRRRVTGGPEASFNTATCDPSLTHVT